MFSLYVIDDEKMFPSGMLDGLGASLGNTSIAALAETRQLDKGEGRDYS